MLYNCYIFICDCIHIFFRKHGFRDQRQRRGKEKVDYGEGFAMTGFYVALNEDNGAGMAGFSPEAVLRTLSGLRIRNPGKHSATGGDITHTAKNPAPFGTGFFLNAKTKSSVFRLSFLLYLMPGSLWRASCPPPSGPLLRNVQIRSRRICPAPESTHRQTTDKTKGPVFRLSLLF
ncbi:TPA: hypothetical protein RUY79_000001, partial [Klebsiella quasipneumoniae subsp. quasipneumoniae]|nr:hypothetical protein [Klebsiella quasipneumoniae]HDZ9164720.1 hypothetical protein [Klebsiella quasipneumoniae subsp. quasipneumoniae]